jgi:hypothetical protein
MSDMMHSRLRLFLPLAQVVVAAALITSHYLRRDSMSDPSWVKPDWQICGGLNAPATLFISSLQHAIYRWLPGHFWLDFTMYYVIWTIGYLLLIALIWYFVSIEMSCINRDWLSALTPRTGARALADSLLVVFGVALGLGGLVAQSVPSASRIYPIIVATPYLIWAIFLVVFYGHDLWVYLGQIQRMTRRRDIL